MKALQTKSRIEESYKIPLPDNLPSSFFFAGPELSVVKIAYTLDVSFIGLKSQNGPVPEATLLFKETKHFKLRKADTKIERGISRQETGKIASTFGSNGEATV